MTMIDVDTSPLQAAREWRGIGLVSAAMSSGLTMSQAEALEEGDPSVFGTIDEMIASAVVYGASIGIGRDEATALLDRTVCRTGALVDLPDGEAARPSAEFSGAVQQRSARISDRVESSIPVFDPIVDPIVDEHAFEPIESSAFAATEEADPPEAPATDLPEIPHGPTPQQAVEASGEIHLDDAFGPEAPWERIGHTGELAAWADDLDDDGEMIGSTHERGGSVGVRIGGTMHAALERIVGTDRADATADRAARLSERAGEVTRVGRERLRRSEHATLFVAIGGGALLIALLVAIGGAMGSDDATGPAPADRTAPSTPAAEVAAAVKDAPVAKKPVAKRRPMLAPGRINVDIFNAGSKKGYAKQVADKLDAAGYKIGEVTNASDFATATVIHPKNMAREARVIARRTGVDTLKVAPGSTRRITVVVT